MDNPWGTVPAVLVTPEGNRVDLAGCSSRGHRRSIALATQVHGRCQLHSGRDLVLTIVVRPWKPRHSVWRVSRLGSAPVRPLLCGPIAQPASCGACHSKLLLTWFRRQIRLDHV